MYVIRAILSWFCVQTYRHTDTLIAVLCTPLEAKHFKLTYACTFASRPRISKIHVNIRCDDGFGFNGQCFSDICYKNSTRIVRIKQDPNAGNSRVALSSAHAARAQQAAP